MTTYPIGDDIAIVYHPPSNPQFGFRGGYTLRVEDCETWLSRDEAQALRDMLGTVIDAMTPWQDKKK